MAVCRHVTGTTQPLGRGVRDRRFEEPDDPVEQRAHEEFERRPFDVASYDPSTQAITYTGPAVSALPNENGRKDTVQAHPGEVTRIRARFELPDEGTIELPPGVANPQYVWHCHILEHEENDMMRAFEVVQ